MLKTKLVCALIIVLECLINSCRKDNFNPIEYKDADFYVAPYGNDSNPGTYDKPWKTWTKAFNTANAGDTVYFRGGVYYSTCESLGERGFNKGTPSEWIYFVNYPGETPVLDCSFRNLSTYTVNKGIVINESGYLYFRGLHIKNIYQQLDGYAEGIGVFHTGNIIFENIVVHHVNGVGYNCSDWWGTIKFINCDAYNCNDSLMSPLTPPASPGQNGVGFQYKNVTAYLPSDSSKLFYKGCRVWNFSDNGFAGISTGYVEFESCWAFNGGELTGEGCGFKFASSNGDTCKLDLGRVIKNCIAAYNGGYGYSPNNYGKPIVSGHYYNNVAYKSGFKGTSEVGRGFAIFNYAGTIPGKNELYANNISYDNEFGEVYEGDTYTHEYNSWDLAVDVTDDDFISLNWKEMLTQRKDDGSLPDINFLRLKRGSDLIDAGKDVGLPYLGEAPDLGAFEVE